MWKAFSDYMFIVSRVLFVSELRHFVGFPNGSGNGHVPGVKLLDLSLTSRYLFRRKPWCHTGSLYWKLASSLKALDIEYNTEAQLGHTPT
jgi:hypothetical protein